MCGPDGAAVLYYGLPQLSTRCSSTQGEEVRRRARRVDYPARPRGEASRTYPVDRIGVTTDEMRAAPLTGSESGRFLGGYRHTALDCDDAMVLGVGEFGAEE